ncbi:hypothetical protein COO60DRAFT_675072 [Scenedesmus sp. NREL 46B-D3]|nr:hypothetical protein COO60DRAFT_675072 [Scenedesmus sp. NREL 46B-D3]
MARLIKGMAAAKRRLQAAGGSFNASVVTCNKRLAVVAAVPQLQVDPLAGVLSEGGIQLHSGRGLKNLRVAACRSAGASWQHACEVAAVCPLAGEEPGRVNEMLAVLHISVQVRRQGVWHPAHHDLAAARMSSNYCVVACSVGKLHTHLGQPVQRQSGAARCVQAGGR